ncbi:MAG TPA: RNA polymerase sigma factor, partial [Isosphaeraceae bacterium]|nr:RNA polymerase sigma factor [Isosphaeraceae bacterium]
MSIGQKGAVDRQLRTLFQSGTSGASTDGELIDQFVNGSERAFEVLLDRHGPMVFRVCRSVLHHEHDAQDAFQAVFVVLARRARSLWVRDSIGPWLHGVAYRVAMRARTAQARRLEHERRKAEMQSDRVLEGDTGEIARVLHEEIERLPARFRAAIILFDLQGLSLEQAAHRMGCPVGTIKSRLARGRDRLRDRLERRGLAPNGVGCLPIVTGSGLWPSYTLTDLTRTVAFRAAAGPWVGILSPSVDSLVSGVLRMMHWKRWAVGLSACVAMALVGFGVSTVSGQLQTGEHAKGSADREPLTAEKAGTPRPPEEGLQYRVRVIDTPGLWFRKTGLGFDYEISPTAGLSFLSDQETDLLLHTFQSNLRTNIVEAPKVTSSSGAANIFTSRSGAEVIEARNQSTRPAEIVLRE